MARDRHVGGVLSTIAVLLALSLLMGCAGVVPRRGGYSRVERVEQAFGARWEKESVPAYSTGDKAAIAANALCTVADIVTTEIGLANGHEESHPFLQKRGVRIPLLLIASGAAWAIGEWTGYRKLLNGGRAAFSCGAAAWNVTVIE